jgi:L-ribulose-5-phosphate 3-epimerase
VSSSLSVRIGVRAHDFGILPAGELAAKIAAKQMVCAQLALGKAIAGFTLKPGILNPGLAFEIGEAFHNQGVQIAVLGCYVNPIHPDPTTRQSLLGLFKEHLRYARDFGNGLVALETGSVNADYSPHPKNHGETAFQQSVASIAELVAGAERFGVIVGI